MTIERRSPLSAVRSAAGSLLLCGWWSSVSSFQPGCHAPVSGRSAAGSSRRRWCGPTPIPRGGVRLPSRAASVAASGAVEPVGRDCDGDEEKIKYEALAMERPVDTVLLQEGRGLRVHCLSDLHTDYRSNMAWVKTLPSWKASGEGELGAGHEDVLLVAGDVSSSLERLAETLTDLKERYDQVFFVAGNHDLWTRRRKDPTSLGGKGSNRCRDDGGSVGKLLEVHRVCKRAGVRTDPAMFVLGGEQGDDRESSPAGAGWRDRQREVGVFPLLSWYHASWDEEPDLPSEDQFRNGDFFRRWGDYVYCRWPASLCSREDFVTVSRDASPVLADFFARQNDACIDAFRLRAGAGEPSSSAGGRSDAATPTKGDTVISFSHFVPRQELCPEKRFLSEPNLTKAIGSAPLERQIRELGSDLHVFGHTHIPIDISHEGVRYLQWPLGSVMEQSRQCRRMHAQGPLTVYAHDGREGGLTPTVQTVWGDYYRENPRDVRETFVPEWALKRKNGRRKGQAKRGADPFASTE